jgi:hypothetical protein
VVGIVRAMGFMAVLRNEDSIICKKDEYVSTLRASGLIRILLNPHS